ncbi:MAG: glutaredoxin domain-containing protein [bacterium]
MKIMIYSTPSCAFCVMAKEFFKANNVPFEEFNVAADLEKRKEMMQKTGQMGVPVIDIDGSIVIGFDKEVIAKKLGIKI